MRLENWADTESVVQGITSAGGGVTARLVHMRILIANCPTQESLEDIQTLHGVKRAEIERDVNEDLKC